MGRRNGSDEGGDGKADADVGLWSGRDNVVGRNEGRRVDDN